MKIRVLIVDDHALVRDGLTKLFSAEPDMEVVGEAADGREAIQLAEALQPDVVVMDLVMPQLNGIDATREIRRTRPAVRIIMLSMYATSQLLHHASRAGADGYVVKGAGTAEVLEAVRTVCTGKRYVGNSLAGTSAGAFLDLEPRAEGPIERLSARERQILQLIVEGNTSAQIAQSVSLSVKTIETYRSRMMRKLDIDNLPALVKFAIQHGLTSLE